jgi:3-oxoacyl-[acyl-carrier-protein] synthase III
MRIEAIGVAVPSRRISNEAVLRAIAEASPHAPDDLVVRYQRAVAHAFKSAGCGTRFVRDLDQGETALGLLQSAVRDALTEADLRASQVDLLLYCGVAKGYLEPATAYAVAARCGLACDCFDVGDACMGWLRAVFLASKLLEVRAYKRVLIVNAECGFYEHGYPELLQVRSMDALKHTFPAYTIGEAATATIVSGDGSDWAMQFSSAPEHSALCGIPLAGHQHFADTNGCAAPNGIGMLYAFGGEMIHEGKRGLVGVIRRTVLEVQRPQTWFPHVVAVDAAYAVADELGVERSRVFVDAFRVYGNVVSASVPLSMSMALKAGVLRRGNRAAACVGSAGMSFGVAEFEF